MDRKHLLSLTSIVLFCAAATANAATVNGSINDNTGYTVSNIDLLQTTLAGAPVTTGDFVKESGAGLTGEPGLRNGLFGALGGQQGAPAGEGNSVIYTLDLTGAPAGYHIYQVNSYSGWSYGRYGQAYDLSFHLVGAAPGVFTTPISVSYGPGTGETPETSAFPEDLHGNFSTFVSVTDPTGKLATGVDGIRFVFHASPNYVGDYNGYRELDVIGAVPEPGSLSLLFVGAIGMLAFRRRKGCSTADYDDSL